MPRYLKSFLIILLALIVKPVAFSQDLHFSQFFNNPLLTNPANTGFIPDADYRLGASYRNQYSNIMAVPYKTMSIYGDAQVFRNKIENGWLGLGGVILRDVAGSGSLTSTKIYGSVAYHQMLGLSSLLTAGFNLGWANKRIDQSKLTEDVYINAGYSIHHVNRPQETFFENDGANAVDMRHIGFLNGIFKMNENVIINPNAFYTTQAKSSELVVGLNGAYNLSGDGDKVLFGGVYYR